MTYLFAVSHTVLLVTGSLSDVVSLCLVIRSGRSSAERNDSPLQYSCLENSIAEGPWDRKVSDMTERLHFHLHLLSKGLFEGPKSCQELLLKEILINSSKLLSPLLNSSIEELLNFIAHQAGLSELQYRVAIQPLPVRGLIHIWLSFLLPTISIGAAFLKKRNLL